MNAEAVIEEEVKRLGLVGRARLPRAFRKTYSKNPMKRGRPGVLSTWGDIDEDWFAKLPDSVKYNLERAAEESSPFERRNSGLGWSEVIANPNADGTVVSGTAAETILVPDVSIPGGYMSAGKTLRYTIMGRQSTVITTPGTLIFRMRWGGVGGTSMVASGAFAPDPTAAATNLTFMLEFWIQQRAVGVTGASMSFGRIEWSDYDDASATTVVGNLNMRLAPTSAPATAVTDTTIDKLLSATTQASVTTGSVQAHYAVLESLN